MSQATLSAKLISKNEIMVEADLTKTAPQSLRLVRKEDADISIPIDSIKVAPGTGPGTDKPVKSIILVPDKLDSHNSYLLTAKDLGQTWSIAPSMAGILIAAVLAAALVNNFVFTKYLGLCVFFGVSKRKDTAIGMGITFTIVCLLSSFLAFLVQQFALAPHKLGFLSIVIFIGIIACLVQAADTILKKIQPALHRKFGIYLVLITTNCIILAVPLLNAANNASFLESMALSFGAGLGFALAMFLMSCARESVELAPVPAVFRGLPIAFILAGLFALSFLGFSGLKL